MCTCVACWLPANCVAIQHSLWYPRHQSYRNFHYPPRIGRCITRMMQWRPTIVIEFVGCLESCSLAPPSRPTRGGLLLIRNPMALPNVRWRLPALVFIRAHLDVPNQIICLCISHVLAENQRDQKMQDGNRLPLLLPNWRAMLQPSYVIRRTCMHETA